MQTLLVAVRECAALVVDQFYEELHRLPKSRRILGMLSAHELAHLKAKQVENMLALADPALTSAEHADMALRIGRIHAIVGLDKEDLARSRAILQDLLFARLHNRVDGDALSRYSSCLASDLAWQIKAYQDVQDAQQRVLLRVTHLVWQADGYANFIESLIGVLSSHDEIAACIIGRPDESGIFHFEAAARGNGTGGLLETLMALKQPVSVRADHRNGQGAIGRAWRSGKPERIVNFQTDPLVVAWRELAQQEGLRSSVAIPLVAPGHAPIAVLVLFSEYPGGFIGPQQVAFVDLLQTLLGCAAGSFDIASEAVPVSVRQHRAALVRAGALEMHYQPLLNLTTWQVEKVEALARLRDGERLLGPDEFLSALASDDLLALYESGLNTALADRSRWLRDGLDLEVSINVPPAALNDIRYFEATRAALAQHRCPGAKLTLEVLENDSISMSEGQRAILARFRALGSPLAQDDLGSGHSGLARLRELPFDWIKIDRDIATARGDGALDALRFVYQLTRLGHALGKLVLAEGIDTPELLDALSILGVDGAQGFVIARPMAPAQLAAWMKHPPLRPVAQRDESGLVRLARFVAWEERVALIAAMPGVAARIVAAARAPETSVANTAAAADTFARVLAGFDAIMPAGEQSDAVRDALLNALVNDGRNSDAYRSAVRRLRAAIDETGTA